MDTEKIKVIMKMFEESQISKLDLQDGDLKIILEKNMETVQYVESTPVVINNQSVNNEVKEEAKGTAIKSPLVGTFYASSGKDKEPYVKVGSHISEGDTVCIIEAMKVMNEIKAQVSGTVLSIDVKDGDTVEFDQVLVMVG
ncbi:MAG: acetyl-CoA carboxylase biotin carboxyl carrier protein [Coprobacillus sp.]